MKFYVYILECVLKNNITYYTGFTNNLERRIREHAAGRGAKYTKSKELTLVHFETFKTRSEAMKREREIKKLPLKKKLSIFIN